MGRKVSNIRNSVSRALHTSRGKNILLYLLFCMVAFVFWFMLSLDTEVQKDYEIPVELTGVPDSVTVISNIPASVSVTVKAKGGQLLRYTWGKMPVMRLDFRSYDTGDGRLYLSKARIDARIRDYFGNGCSISGVKPDTISILYTTHPGHRVPVIVEAEIHPDIQCIVNGPLKCNLDSVSVYTATGELPHGLTAVYTEKLAKSGLKDSTTYEVRLRCPAGVRVIPDRVLVTVPVEPLISKKRAVQVEVTGAPEGERVLTFPSKVDVSYLVPMSMYNDEYPIRVTVNYEDTNLPGDKVPVTLGQLPSYYHNASLAADSVEYLIEKRQK